MGQDNHNGALPPEREQPPVPGSGPDDGGAPQSRHQEQAPPPWGQSPLPQPDSRPGQWGAPAPQPPQQNPWGQPNPWSREPTGPQADRQQGAPLQGGAPQQWGAPLQWGTPLQQGGWSPPPKPGVIPLRPLRLGELLDGAFQACRRNAAATFGTALLIQAVVAVLTFFFARDLFSPAVMGGDLGATEAGVDSTLTAATVLGIVSAVGALLLQGILVVPVARSILNLKTGFAQTWKLCRTRLLPLAGLGLLLTAMIVVGFVVFGFLLVLIVDALGAASIPLVIVGVLALIAVYVFLAVKLALAPAALVLEPAGVFRSLGRSWQLTRRNFWRAFGILALTTVLVSIVASIITTPVALILGFVGAFGSGGDGGAGTAVALVALNLAITTFFSAVGYAFQAGVTSLLYVDLRMRREGFDITLMKEQELSDTDADLVPGRRNSGTFE